MASVFLRKVPIKLENLLPKPSARCAEVDSVRARYKIDPDTHKPDLNNMEGYSLDFYAVGGALQTVKLPLDVEPTIKKIREALEKDSIVKVNFGTPSTLRAHPYAMIQSDCLISGVTASATTVDIVKIEAPELEDLDEIID